MTIIKVVALLVQANDSAAAAAAVADFAQLKAELRRRGRRVFHDQPDGQSATAAAVTGEAR